MTELETAAKGNRVLAWFIIGFIVLAALITFVNHLWQLVDRIVKR